MQMPIATFQSGPVNSLRGAAFLSGCSDAIVCDIGGTTTDVGRIARGLPCPCSGPAMLAGARTNFRMPDVVSIGIPAAPHEACIHVLMAMLGSTCMHTQSIATCCSVQLPMLFAGLQALTRPALNVIAQAERCLQAWAAVAISETVQQVTTLWWDQIALATRLAPGQSSMMQQHQQQ